MCYNAIGTSPVAPPSNAYTPEQANAWWGWRANAGGTAAGDPAATAVDAQPTAGTASFAQNKLQNDTKAAQQFAVGGLGTTVTGAIGRSTLG
jgi:hypothetical protein